MKRSAGILLAISSLPSNYGIGTFGKAAYDFADFLEAAGQKFWQMLPLGPTSFGDSPYQSFSTFAGNPYYVDLDMLIEDGLLKKEEVDAFDWGDSNNGNSQRVDYEKIYNARFSVLEKAKERGWEEYLDEIETWRRDNAEWIENYALFMALKRHFNMCSWLDWPEDDIRKHEDAAVERYREVLKDDIELYVFIQYLFFKQWNKLRDYIHSKGLKIIGDIPIYVAMDSSDAWAERRFLQFDEDGYPLKVGGVPPDYFNADGQLWGNPLYDWEKIEADGYGWWIRRIGAVTRLFDVIRFDHFRALDEYWAVPFGSPTAVTGEWIKGPGIKFINMLNSWFLGTEFIAEDLGILGPSVHELVEESTWPGMKVLQFAFSPDVDSEYLPHNHVENSICYTGTHDNNTCLGWFGEAGEDEIKKAVTYLGLNEKEGYVKGFIRAGMGSVAKLFVAPMQDYLEQGDECRMNLPGVTNCGNWQYRMQKGLATKELAGEIAEITKLYGR